MRAPPTSGPAIAPADITVMFRAFAAGSSSAGRIRGRMATLVGWLTAKKACCAEKVASNSRGAGRRRR